MPVSIRSMRYFVTALNRGNITQAAADLHVAPSSVAAAIDQIEAHFQLKLVNRVRSRGIQPTANGKVLQRKFARILEDYDAVLTEGSDLRHALKGELRVGYYAPVAPAFLPQVLSDLSRSGDQTTIYLEECDNDRAQTGLLAGDFDAILFVSHTPHPQIEFDVLVKAPPYCLVPADHALAKAGSVSLGELVGEPIVVLNRPVVADYYRKIFNDFDAQPTTIAYANSTEMVRSYVGAGHGCAILNMLPSTNVSYGGDRVVAVPISDPLPSLSLSIGYGKSSQRRIVSHFVEQCQSYFKDERGMRHIVTSEDR